TVGRGSIDTLEPALTPEWIDCPGAEPASWVVVPCAGRPLQDECLGLQLHHHPLDLVDAAVNAGPDSKALATVREHLMIEAKPLGRPLGGERLDDLLPGLDPHPLSNLEAKGLEPVPARSVPGQDLGHEPQLPFRFHHHCPGHDPDEATEGDVSRGQLPDIGPRVEGPQMPGAAGDLRHLAAVVHLLLAVDLGGRTHLTGRSLDQGGALALGKETAGVSVRGDLLQPDLLPEEATFGLTSMVGASIAAEIVQE